MNYDEYLTQEQYKHDDRPLNDDKVWCVFTDEKLLVAFDKKSISEDFYNRHVKEVKEGVDEIEHSIELGWVYPNDFDDNNHPYTYRLLNVVESYKKE